MIILAQWLCRLLSFLVYVELVFLGIFVLLGWLLKECKITDNFSFGHVLKMWCVYIQNLFSHFRSVCYTFITLNAMNSIVLELWNLSYIYYVIFAKYSIILECWALGILPTYCMNISIMLTVMTSVDRLFVMVASKL